MEASKREEWLSFPTIQERAKRQRKLRKVLSVVGNLHDETHYKAPRRGLRAFVTLTYAPDRPARHGDLRGYLDVCRKRFARRGHKLRYVWVCELQQCGRPHYHLVFWLPPRTRLPKPDDSGMWPHGSSNIQKLRNRGIGYLLKYFGKTEFDCLPKGMRKWGAGGLDADQRRRVRYAVLPRYICRLVEWWDDVVRSGRDYESRFTGIKYSGWHYYEESAHAGHRIE